MREIEKLARSPRWGPATRAAFEAHLARCKSDEKRLEYCGQKASFIASTGRPGALSMAEELVCWAMETYGRGRRTSAMGTMHGTRGYLRECRADYIGAAKDYKIYHRLVPYSAIPGLDVARCLLRANDFVATSEVLALESRILTAKSAEFLQSYAVWTNFVGACCARARGDHAAARSRAQRALRFLKRVPRFEQITREQHPTAVVPDLGLKPEEIEVLRGLAQKPKSAAGTKHRTRK